MDRIEPEQPQQEASYNEEGSIQQQRNMNFLALKGYFGKENISAKEEDQLNTIYDLVTGGDMREMGGVLLFLRSVENKLGVAPLGESRISQVYNYLTVLGSIQDLTAEKAALEQ